MVVQIKFVRCWMLTLKGYNTTWIIEYNVQLSHYYAMVSMCTFFRCNFSTRQLKYHSSGTNTISCPSTARCNFLPGQGLKLVELNGHYVLQQNVRPEYNIYLCVIWFIAHKQMDSFRSCLFFVFYLFQHFSLLYWQQNVLLLACISSNYDPWWICMVFAYELVCHNFIAINMYICSILLFLSWIQWRNIQPILRMHHWRLQCYKNMGDQWWLLQWRSNNFSTRTGF